MIGNLKDAMAVGNGAGTYIGEGCTRRAFLLNNVVYKVGPAAENALEIDNLNRLRDIDLPRDIYIPEVTGYIANEVIAMEYIEGDLTGFCYDCELGYECQYGDCIPEVVNQFFNDNGITDTCYGNLVRRDGQYVLIDAAY